MAINNSNPDKLALLKAKFHSATGFKQPRSKKERQKVEKAFRTWARWDLNRGRKRDVPPTP
jgi:hypothetical protein